MSEIAKTTAANATGVHPIPQPEPSAHEAYSFACMKCGYGWEQAYEIVHQLDTKGRERVVYYTDGERVPSPLTCPTCLSCGSNVVRIMRSGQVSMVSHAIANMHQRQPAGEKGPRAEKHDRNEKKGTPAAERTGSTAEAPPEAGKHHWHLSDLLHPFQHHRR
ncbi:hypothetical protein HEK616_02030 [Streptomyces nigrescens]|uniref:Uncharacterized protein n=2 Tax=Streptomyces TaxID=1883 RepID=A0ABM7ZLK8_STRNI|nr:hypothetical protein [Streptomyces nigrescens]MEE4424754.1 hypothetical protein [Streptomyces sp. DSM 41528]BDM66716.1 hypothetical protein HEK616_02030 [Streptomyces nigrescens]